MITNLFRKAQGIANHQVLGLKIRKPRITEVELTAQISGYVWGQPIKARIPVKSKGNQINIVTRFENACQAQKLLDRVGILLR
jgi:hypothetical protein